MSGSAYCWTGHASEVVGVDGGRGEGADASGDGYSPSLDAVAFAICDIHCDRFGKRFLLVDEVRSLDGFPNLPNGLRQESPFPDGRAKAAVVTWKVMGPAVATQTSVQATVVAASLRQVGRRDHRQFRNFVSLPHGPEGVYDVHILDERLRLNASHGDPYAGNASCRLLHR